MPRITARNPKLPAPKQKKDAMDVKRTIRYWLPVLICMVIIFHASSIHGRDIPPLFPFQDVAFHFFVYLALCFFFARALKNTYRNMSGIKLIIFTVIFGFIYGASDELHQAFVPYRSVSCFDVLIDTLGSFAGSLIYRWPR